MEQQYLTLPTDPVQWKQEIDNSCHEITATAQLETLHIEQDRTFDATNMKKFHYLCHAKLGNSELAQSSTSML